MYLVRRRGGAQAQPSDAIGDEIAGEHHPWFEQFNRAALTTWTRRVAPRGRWSEQNNQDLVG